MTDIVNAIYSLYEQDHPKVLRARTPTASSGLASICLRYAWYEAHPTEPRVVSTLLRRRMWYGVVHEDNIRDELRFLQDKKTGWEIKGAGMRLELWGIRGKIDLLVKEREVWKLLEVKTMNPEDFKKFQTEGFAAFPRYYEQAMFYLAACEGLPWREQDVVNKGILLAENTFPLGELAAEEFELDHDCVYQMKENLDQLREIIPLPTPPPRSFTYESSNCTHCWRKHECWEVRQEIHSISATQLADPKEMGHLVTEYLRYNDQKEETEETLDKVKGRIRQILDENKATDISVPISHDLHFTITLSQVSVAKHTVESFSFPRLSIR